MFRLMTFALRNLPRWLAAAVFLAGFSSVLRAQTKSGESPALLRAVSGNASDHGRVAGHRPWVWEVRGPRATVWIVGVLHIAGRDEAACYEHYLDYYQAARSLHYETIPGAWSGYSASRLLEHRGGLPKSANLRSLVGEKTASLLDEALRLDPTGFADLERRRPWLAAMEIEKAAYRRAGLSAEAGLEHRLLNLAVRDRKPVGALETTAEQIAPIVRLPVADQEASLAESLRDFLDGSPVLAKMRAAWIAGDEAALKRAAGLVTNEGLTADRRAMLQERNERWMGKLSRLAKGDENALVVVGVNHLVVPGAALPDLLRAEGFNVQRVK